MPTKFTDRIHSVGKSLALPTAFLTTKINDGVPTDVARRQICPSIIFNFLIFLFTDGLPTEMAVAEDSVCNDAVHFRAKTRGAPMEDDDSELAFNLQVQEALAASVLDGAVSSTNATSVSDDAVSADNPYEYEQELLLLDQYNEKEAKRLRLDLTRQIHDRALACEIASVPEEEWSRTGNNLNRPFAEGSSSSNDKEGLNFRVYVKGLMEQMFGGIGVAICDGNGGLVFELSKGFSGKEQQANNQEFVELKALIEGLDVAVLLDLKRFSIITGEKPPMTRNVAPLCEQLNLHLRKFADTQVSIVASEEIKFADELARNAIALRVNRSSGNSNTKNLTESCAICFEDTYADQMFVITGCVHRYCFPCMSKHVQFKLLQGSLPKCPHENCKSKLKLDSCKSFLTPELFVILSQRMKEATIPAEDKIYCPYPKCSTLLSKTELRGSVGPRVCPECSGAFCIDCKVPWHSNMNCVDFKKLNPYPCKEDKKLKDLATENLWRQCPKCSHMVSLAIGCYHIYCRCGHEFCYTCGAEWKDKKATCTCRIWDEHNIIKEDEV
ncbi:putative uncharacterized protein at4g01020 chloroplastic [Phtheirospermum japonicum]|uniref:RBR-type E3 ubiquitin transferase n=1 Tax=Phtheirospermum japonicum TaxID=374723 RepID=A0A830D6B9_9LAMI|nr:putative uncharacterized protein at4g01020 chloroplastic [Phtheirospermum japonicum]